MKTYLDMDEILRHCRRYIGQEYDEPYLVSAVPEEVIRSLPPADVAPARHGRWVDEKYVWQGLKSAQCNQCKRKTDYYIQPNYCPKCGAKMDGVPD